MTERAVPRGPLTVTVDGDLRSALTGAAVRQALAPAVLGRTFGMWLLLGLVFVLASGALATFLVVGLGIPALMLGIAVVRTRRSVGEALPLDTTVTSSYDERGRLVIVRATGERVLAPGWASAVQRHGDVAVIRRRGRRTAPLVTPSALVTEADAALLTSRVSAPPTALPYGVVITPEVQSDLVAGQVRVMLRHPAMAVVIALVLVSAALVLLLPTELAWRMGLLLVVVLLFVLVVLPRVGIRQLYPVGTSVGADVDDAALLLDVPGLPQRLPRDQIAAVERTPHCLVVRRHGSARQLVLPRDLLPDDVLGAVARPHAAS